MENLPSIKLSLSRGQIAQLGKGLWPASPVPLFTEYFRFDTPTGHLSPGQGLLYFVVKITLAGTGRCSNHSRQDRSLLSPHPCSARMWR